ncbi:MAG: hypothetical protein RLO50_11110 [Azospirillaceae bacterium]
MAFLKDRTDFIRWYYDTAGVKFREIMRKIETGEAPYEPPYSEDPEPPFLSEWIEAETGLDVLGRNCISMLSASLQLYFKTWEAELGVTWEEGERKPAFKYGFLRGYQTCFGEVLKLSWNECPADLELIEQVVIARNRDQHPETTTSMRVSHSYKERKRHRHLFFVSVSERRMFDDPAMADIAWMNPSVHVSCELLFQALDQVETLAEWLEPHMIKRKYR